jgi:hypothetical protein
MEYTRTASREFEVGDRLTLDIDGRSGNTVVEGRETDRVTVQIIARVVEDSTEAADEVLEQILGGIRHDGDQMRIITPSISGSGPWFLFGRGMRVDYTLTVPRATTCRIASRSGRVEAVRVDGPVQVEQRSGRTTVREIGGDVRVNSRSGSTEIDEVDGSIEISAHSGRIAARGIRGDARLSSHSGSIEAERVDGSVEAICHSGNLQIMTVGGDVKAVCHSGRMSVEEVGGDAVMEAGSGPVMLTGARGRARVRGNSGSITVRGPVLGDMELQTSSGGIRLEVDPDRPFFIDAESVSGSVHSDIPPRRDGPPSEDAPRVQARTTSGSIRLSRYVGR